MALVLRYSEIRNPAMAKAVVDFSCLKGIGDIDNAMPTDIDGVFELRNRVFGLIEFKTPGAPLSVGQQMALERITDAISLGGKRAFLVVCEGEIKDGTIYTSESWVRSFYKDGQWKDVGGLNPVRPFIEDILSGAEALY